jgi:DNA-binding HxlR family transcriptional regulator
LRVPTGEGEGITPGNAPAASGDSATHSAYDGDDIVDLLRLFGAGAAGSILLVLRDGPLRTNELADRVHGFSPRTVYRHVATLVQLGVLERWERPGVPSYVVYSLTESGLELSSLIHAFAKASLELQPDGQVVPQSWRRAALLADLWESTMFDRLGTTPSTMTQLAHVSEGLSFHQVARRIDLLLKENLMREVEGSGRRRRYELTEPARRASALVVALGYWRENHLLDCGEPGLTDDEVREVMKAALSLLFLPRHRGKAFALSVTEAGGGNWREGEVVWATVASNGAVDCNGEPRDDLNGRASATVAHWTEALVGAKGTGVRVSGDKQMIAAVRRGMHRMLWTPPKSGDAATR